MGALKQFEAHVVGQLAKLVVFVELAKKVGDLASSGAEGRHTLLVGHLEAKASHHARLLRCDLIT